MWPSPPLQTTRSRHMACQVCRERKVRCDGAHPTCTRCRRLNSQCVYLPDRRLSARDNERRLTEAIHGLKDRLTDAEARLARSESSSTSSKASTAPSLPQDMLGLPFDFNAFSPSDPLFALLANDLPEPAQTSRFSHDVPSSSMTTTSAAFSTDLTSFGTFSPNGTFQFVPPTPPLPLPLPPSAVAPPPIQQPQEQQQQQQQQTESVTGAHHRRQMSSVFPNSSPPITSNGNLGSNRTTSPERDAYFAPPPIDQSTSYDAYFESMHRCFPFLSPSRFMPMISAPNPAPEFVALKYAVALHSVLLADPNSPSAASLYRAARATIDAAEAENDASISQLSFLQTWVLLTLYEFRYVDFFRAWMTAGRAIRLAKALHLHQMDASPPPSRHHRRPGFEPAMSPATDTTELEDRRSTFWIVYLIDWYGSARTECETSFPVHEVTTLVPTESHGRCYTLAEAMAQPETSYSSVSSFGALVIATALYSRMLSHIIRTKSFDFDASQYDFWSEHWRLIRQCEQSSALLNGHLSLGHAGRDPQIVSLHTRNLSVAIGLHETAAAVIERTASSEAILQECYAKALIAAAAVASIVRGAIKSNFSFARVTWSLYMACMTCLGALRRNPGDIAVMSHLEIMLEGFQRFQPVAPRVDTFISLLCQELEALPPADMALPISSSSSNVYLPLLTPSSSSTSFSLSNPISTAFHNHHRGSMQSTAPASLDDGDFMVNDE